MILADMCQPRRGGGMARRSIHRAGNLLAAPKDRYRIAEKPHGSHGYGTIRRIPDQYWSLRRRAT